MKRDQLVIFPTEICEYQKMLKKKKKQPGGETDYPRKEK